jgi:heat shock protein HslJ
MIKGDKLTISKNIASTLIACSDPLKKTGNSYLATITTTARYQIVGQQLTLFDENDKALASFMKQSSDLNRGSLGTQLVITTANLRS